MALNRVSTTFHQRSWLAAATVVLMVFSMVLPGCGGDGPSTTGSDEISDYVGSQTETFDSGAQLGESDSLAD